MQRFWLSAATVMTALVLSGAGLEAQRGPVAGVRQGPFSVVPYGGYLITGDFIEGPLGTNVGSVSSPLIGVQASLPLAQVFSLVGSVGYASGDLEVGLPVLGGISVGESSALVLDAAVELRAPGLGSRVVPLVQLGGGAIRRELTVAGVSASSTDFQVSGGLGVDVPVAQNVALRLLAKDHYGRVDFGSLGELQARTKDIHNVALVAGLHLWF